MAPAHPEHPPRGHGPHLPASWHAKAAWFPPTERVIAAFSLSSYAAIIELFCGALILVGLFTRPAAFLASGLMAFAYWIAHAPRDLFPVNNGGDAAILYCFVFLYLVFAGPGPWSLDAVRGIHEDRA